MIARLAAAALLLLAPLAARTAPADPAPVVAAERAFAADAAAHGIKAAFLAFAAPDAVTFAPDPVNALQFYGGRPDGGSTLAWAPAWAGIARSGDLGFTTGPWVSEGKYYGRYFTMWKRQPDGGWKWVLDGGVDNAAPAAEPAGQAPRLLPASDQGGSGERAMAEVRAAEARLAAGSRSDHPKALRRNLAPDAMLLGSANPPAVGAAAIAVELATRPPAMELSPGGGGASKAGDLAWTYGDVRWTKGARARRGHYVRLWQKRSSGWALVVDMFLPVDATT